MRLAKARVQNYRSVQDSTEFEVDLNKTILVGPNEAGKTAILRALEHLKPGPLVKKLDPLRDYPRSEYQDFRTSKTDPKDVRVASSEYALGADDIAAVTAIHPAYGEASYELSVYLDGHRSHSLVNAPPRYTYGALKDSLRRLAVHAAAQIEVVRKLVEL